MFTKKWKLFFITSVTLLVVILFNKIVDGRSRSLYVARNSHNARLLSEEEINSLALMTDIDNINQILDQILVPRVVGTPQHKKVANYIVNYMEQLGWSVERNKFKDQTPIFGPLEFQNIIAKLNPNAERYLILSCHYDSKYTREHNFVGATDSAVPCAMIMNLAKVMQDYLNTAKLREEVSLAFIFFDGEEAFKSWGPKDSLYGSRHLAAMWENKPFVNRNNDEAKEIDRIDLLVLLDLLGAANPNIDNYFPETSKWFTRFSEAEETLSEMGRLKNYQSRYFNPGKYGGHIEDDHIPFLRRDVPIVHIIPSPFPEVWHKPEDNRSIIDMDTVENLNKILRVFVAEYLHLQP